jgi:fructose-bisphosphate aldolase class I
MDIQRLSTIANRLVEPKKGILAADESTHTCNLRFAALGIPQTETQRQIWRELLLTTPDLEHFITGVILYDETIRQATSKKISFPDYLEKKGILVGIKVDEGLLPMPGSPLETITQGLSGLPGRLQEYKTMGASFAKWRAAFKITSDTPSDEAIRQNAEILARYAKCCQDEGIVPMVEPEVMLDGDHTIEKTKMVMERVLKAVFEELTKHFVDLKGMILKTSMVISGSQASVRADAKTVAKFTTETLKSVVPPQIPGVVFLSGGQTPDEATSNLREIAKLEPLPWQIAFSYSRALQNDPLRVWAGNPDKFKEAQIVFLEKLEANCLADQGL